MLPSHDCATSLANNLVEYFDNKIELIRCNLEESLNTSYQLSPNAPKFLGVSFEQLSSKDTALQSELKRDFVTPFMNKLILDWKIFKNYRSVSNFSFISKLTERTVCVQLVNHLKENDLYEISQSAYRQLHSTETALLRVQNDIIHAVDSEVGAILTLLDLSAAFDTIDHQKLLDLLNHSFGISGDTLRWFKSYPQERIQMVQIGSSTSEPVTLKYGVPQGSVLGPILFTMYTHSTW